MARRAPLDDSSSSARCLSTGYAGALLATGELDGVEELLQAVERWLDSDPAPARPRAGR